MRSPSAPGVGQATGSRAIIRCLFVVAALLGTSLPFSGRSAASAPVSRANYSHILRIMKPRTGYEPPRTLVEFVGALPSELKSNFTLVYKSRSPHGQGTPPAVSPLFPRVVLFSRDGRLLIAFTGDPSKAGYGVVEAIHFDDASRSFRTSKFVLPEAVQLQPETKAQVRFNGIQNRSECTRCHGIDPRPIFESYNVWSGFYGSLQDQLFEGTTELRDYQEFLKARVFSPEKNVYKLLTWRTDTPVPPYVPPNGKIEGLESFPLLPNTRLGMALTELNRERIFRKIQASRDYDRYKHGIVSVLLSCIKPPFPRTFLSEIRARLERENIQKLERSGLSREQELFTKFRLQELGAGMPENLAEIVWLSNLLGGSHVDWSMAFEPNSLQLFDGILSSQMGSASYYLKEDILLVLLRDLARTDPPFKRYYEAYHAYVDYDQPFGTRLDLTKVHRISSLCRLLADRQKSAGTSLPAPKDAVQPKPFSPIRSFPVLAKCVGCHTGQKRDQASPEFKLLTPALLRSQLLQRSQSGERSLFEEMLARIEPNAHERMPMGAKPLDPSERAELRRYLEMVRSGRQK